MCADDGIFDSTFFVSLFFYPLVLDMGGFFSLTWSSPSLFGYSFFGFAFKIPLSLWLLFIEELYKLSVNSGFFFFVLSFFGITLTSPGEIFVERKGLSCIRTRSSLKA